jgi:hypothetical protein
MTISDIGNGNGSITTPKGMKQGRHISPTSVSTQTDSNTVSKVTLAPPSATAWESATEFKEKQSSGGS